MNSNSIGKTTARNSIYSIVANTWYLLSRFLLTPFILHYLPLAEYGLWTLCFVVISFLALTSIGLESTYIKYVAEFHAREQTERINRLLSTGLFLTCGLAICILLTMWIAMPMILDMLRIEPELFQKASFVFMGTGLIFMLDISLSCFARVLDGLQHMALTAKVKLLTSFLEVVLIVLFLYAGLGVYGMMGAFLIRYMLAIALNMTFAFKLMPGLKIRLHYFDKPSCRLLVAYGGKMQILGFIGIFMSTFDKIIITRFLGLAFTGIYEIGRKMPASGARIPSEISAALMPALSFLQGKDDMDEARMLFLSASRYMALLSAPLFTYLLVVAPYAIYIWLGSGYENATVVMYIISAGVLVNLLTGAGSAAAKGFNRLDWELKYGILNLFLCLLMTPVMAIWFGLAGAAGGVAGSTAIASVYFIWLTNRFFNIPLILYYRQILQPVLVSVVSACVLAYLLPLFVTVGITGRIAAIPVVIGAGVLHLFTSGVLLTVSGGILAAEKEWLLSHIKTTKLKGTHSD